MSVIYALHGEDGVVKYIAHTANDLKYAMPRLRSAAKDWDREGALHVWIREQGLYSFYGKVLEEGVAKEDVKERLRYWHGVYGPDLLSKAPAEDSKRQTGVGRRTISEAHKEAVRKAHTGKVISEHTRELISKAAMGHTRNAGRIQSEATKVRMSHSKHLALHSETAKKGCRWCEGAILEEVLRTL